MLAQVGFATSASAHRPGSSRLATQRRIRRRAGSRRTAGQRPL